MGNQVKPVRFLLAGIGYGLLHCVGHALSPNDPCRTSGEGLDTESYNYIKGCTWVREFGYTVPNTQQAATIRQPTPMRPVSQLVPAIQQAAAPIRCKQEAMSQLISYHSSINHPIPTRCHTKEALVPGKPSKHILAHCYGAPIRLR